MAELRRMRPLLGTYVEVWARGPTPASSIEAAFASVERAHARWSFHERGSELSRLNLQPQQQVAVSDDTLRLLRAARAVMRASGGAFDCTVGGQLVEQGILPDHGGPMPLARGSADDIVLGRNWAGLRQPVRLTLDGIAKGYAVDLALRAMRRSGAIAGWVNAGGDLGIFGAAALPVERRELDGRLTPLGSLCNAALASSRSGAPVHADDRTAYPGHIISQLGTTPATGVWSVLARSGWRADALTKVAANVAEHERAARVADLGGCLLGPGGALS